MIRAVYGELLKMSVQKKNYVMIGAHILFLLLCYLGFRTTSGQLYGHVSGAFGFTPAELSVYLDGLFFARLALIPTFIVLMPIVMATLGGDCIAGEMQDGSLKLFLARPRSRTGIVLAKFIAVYLAGLLYSFYFALVGILIGLLFFGCGPAQLMLLSGRLFGSTVTIMSTSEALFRYFLATSYFSFSLMAIGSTSLFFSTIFNRMSAATIAVISIYFVSYVVGSLPFTENIRPWLLSEMMNNAFVFWLSPIPLGKLTGNLATLSLYISGFLFLSIITFNCKDVR